MAGGCTELHLFRRRPRVGQRRFRRRQLKRSTTPDTDLPKPPPGLGRVGKRWWRSYCLEYSFSTTELYDLLTLCRLIEDAESLAADIRENGRSIPDARGSKKSNPSVRAYHA